VSEETQSKLLKISAARILLRVDGWEIRESTLSVPRMVSYSPCPGQRTHNAGLRYRLGRQKSPNFEWSLSGYLCMGLVHIMLRLIL